MELCLKYRALESLILELHAFETLELTFAEWLKSIFGLLSSGCRVDRVKLVFPLQGQLRCSQEFTKDQSQLNCGVNKGITLRFSGILCHLRDTTRAQIYNIPEKSHVINTIINMQDQMISRTRVLIIQVNKDLKITSNHPVNVDSTSY